MKLRAAFGLLRQAFADWREDKASRLAAALAYYTVFAVAPLLLVAIAIAGLAFGREAAEGEIVREMQGLLGRDGAAFLEETLRSARASEARGLAAAVGAVMLLFGASGVFAQLKDGLNTIWEVQPRPGRGVLGVVKDRFASFTMVLGIGFLLLVSLAASAGLRAVGELAAGVLPASPILLWVVHAVVSLAAITLLFGMMFKVLPDVRIGWGDVWAGALATALLFVAGKFALGVYLGSGEAGSAFGAAGGLVILLIWVYWSAQIFFFGAELTQAYARLYGSRIVPDEDAVAVTEEARAQQGLDPVSSAAAGSAEGGPGAARGSRRATGARGRRAPYERDAHPAAEIAREPGAGVGLASDKPEDGRYSAVGAGLFVALTIWAALDER